MIIEKNGNLSEDFVKLQNTLNPDYSIEIGAHAAEFSIHMSNNFNIPCVAFEANTEVFKKYKDVVDKKVSYLNYAISDTDGEVSFNIHVDDLAGNNSILKRNNTKIIKEYKVKSYTLDSYFKDIPFSNACLWIDVEGANKEVLSGAKETLSRCSSIFIETEDYEYWKNQWLTVDVIKYLKGLGFKKIASEKVYDAQQNIIFTK